MTVLHKTLYTGVFSLAALAFAVGAYVFATPSTRQSVLHMFGAESFSKSLALNNACLLNTKQQGEEVFFLSCGGIY